LGTSAAYALINSEKEELKIILVNELSSNKLTFLRMLRDQEKKEAIENLEEVLGSEINLSISPYNVWASEEWEKTFSDSVNVYKAEYPDHNLSSKE
jgi:hypothetical protein